MKKELLIVVVSNIINVLGGVLFLKFLVLSLEVEEVARFGVILAFTAFANALFIGPLSSTITRNIKIYFANFEIKKLAIFSLVVVILGAGITSLIILLYNYSISAEKKLYDITLLLVIWFLFSSSLNTLFNSTLNILRLRIQFCINQIVEQLVKVLLIFIFASSYVLDAIDAFFIFIIVAQFLNFLNLVHFFVIKKKFIRGLESASLQNGLQGSARKLIEYFLPILIMGLFAWGSQVFNRLLIGSSIGLKEAALYYTYSSIFYMPFLMIGSTLSIYAFPIIQDRIDGNHESDINSIETKSVVLGLINLGLLSSIFFLIPEMLIQKIVIFFLSEDYLRNKLFMFGFLFSGYIFAFGSVLSIRYNLYRKTKTLSMYGVISSSAALLFSLTFIDIYGMGAPILALNIHGMLFFLFIVKDIFFGKMPR